MSFLNLIPLDLCRHCGKLYDFMSADDQYLFSSSTVFKTEPQFADWLIQRLQCDFHDFYVAEAQQQVIGFVHNYDFSLQDGHCKLVVYVDDAHRNQGLGGIAAVMFMRKLFADYPLRKIYLTVYDYNLQSKNSCLRAGFTDEGAIREYRYFDGRYYDLHYLSMTRQKFADTLNKLVRE